MNEFDILDQAIKTFFKGVKIRNYGNAVFKNTKDDFVRYVTESDSPVACSVNDAFDVVCFYTRDNADQTPDSGSGRAGSYLRTVDCTLACNAKRQVVEMQLASIINSLQNMAYISTNFDSKSVASQYFGIEDQNYQTSFFSIRFRVTERLPCPPC
jgi:hypothetical protein